MKRLLLTMLSMLGGAFGGTAVAFSGLFAFGFLFLEPHDSLFDRNPAAAELFFNSWFALIAIGLFIGWRLSQKLQR
jgi:hypothetical protein